VVGDPPSENDPTAVRVGYLANGVPSGLGYVLEEGRLFESHKLRASYQRFGSVDGIVQAFRTGTVDIVVGLPTITAARLLEQDTPVVVAAAVQQSNERVLVPISSTIQTIADIKGKSLATPGLDSPTGALIAAILSEGYDITTKDYRTSVASETQLVQLLDSGKVDAALLQPLTIAGLPDPGKYRVVADMGKEFRYAFEVNGPPVLGTVTLRKGYVAGYPDSAAGAVAAVISAVRWGKEHPREVQQLMTRNLRMTQQNAQNYSAAWNDMFMANLDDATVGGMMAAYEQYQANGLLNTVPDKAMLFDQALFQQAIALSR
jgi:NitT/TauT family transport system substrate-binding protein